jgi:hypothetical protein
MKLTFITPALVAVLGLALAGTTLHAQTAASTTSSSTTTSTSSTKMTKKQYGGTITAVDTAANTVTVKSKKHTLTLTVDASTKFKNAAALSDFAVGDKVSGSYMKDAAGTMSACTLTKSAAK